MPSGDDNVRWEQHCFRYPMHCQHYDLFASVVPLPLCSLRFGGVQSTIPAFFICRWYKSRKDTIPMCKELCIDVVVIWMANSVCHNCYTLGEHTLHLWYYFHTMPNVFQMCASLKRMNSFKMSAMFGSPSTTSILTRHRRLGILTPSLCKDPWLHLLDNKF